MQQSNIEIKIEQMARYMQQEFRVSLDEAHEIIYEEWDFMLPFMEAEDKNWFKLAANELKTLYMVA